MAAHIKGLDSIIQGLRSERKLWGQELAQQGTFYIFSYFQVILDKEICIHFTKCFGVPHLDFLDILAQMKGFNSTHFVV